MGRSALEQRSLWSMSAITNRQPPPLAFILRCPIPPSFISSFQTECGHLFFRPPVLHLSISSGGPPFLINLMNGSLSVAFPYPRHSNYSTHKTAPYRPRLCVFVRVCVFVCEITSLRGKRRAGYWSEVPVRHIGFWFLLLSTVCALSSLQYCAKSNRVDYRLLQTSTITMTISGFCCHIIVH